MLILVREGMLSTGLCSLVLIDFYIYTFYIQGDYFDQSSPVNPVSESWGGGVPGACQTNKQRRRAEILVFNIRIVKTWIELFHSALPAFDKAGKLAVYMEFIFPESTNC